MKGYLKNEAATEEAFAGGWFSSGDLAVKDNRGLSIAPRSAGAAATRVHGPSGEGAVEKPFW